MQAGDELNIRGLAAKAAHDALRRNGGFLDHDRREDLISYLCVVGLTAKQNFDPAYGQAESTFLYRRMRVRVVDWYRTTFGDSRSSDPTTTPRSAVLTDLPVPVYDAPQSFQLAVDELGRGLTPQARDTLETIGVALVAGYQEWEIARALELTVTDVRERLTTLRDELTPV